MIWERKQWDLTEEFCIFGSVPKVIPCPGNFEGEENEVNFDDQLEGEGGAEEESEFWEVEWWIEFGDLQLWRRCEK